MLNFRTIKFPEELRGQDTRELLYCNPQKSLLKSSYPKKILAKIFLPEKILKSKILNPKKSFDHSCHYI